MTEERAWKVLEEFQAATPIWHEQVKGQIKQCFVCGIRPEMMLELSDAIDLILENNRIIHSD